jgi:tetratricopeptide (TPR) repeat protein
MRASKVLCVTAISLSLLFASGAVAQSTKSAADNLFAEGYSLLQAGDAQAAADKFEAGLKSSPQNPLAHFFLGKAFFTLQKYEPAKAHLAKSLELDLTNKYAPDAKTLLQQIAAMDAAVAAEINFWKAAAASNTEQYYNAYLQSYPKGPHLPDAKSALAKIVADRELQAQKQEDIDWKIAQIQGRPGFKTFLQKYPNSRFSAEAKGKLVWQPLVDPATHMMWAPEDNGANVSWPEANAFCRGLRLGGFSDWHLPTKEEVRAISYKKGDKFFEGIGRGDPPPQQTETEGGIAAVTLPSSCQYWGDAKEGSKKAEIYWGVLGTGVSMQTHYDRFNGQECGFRALCVRGPVQGSTPDGESPQFMQPTLKAAAKERP